MTFELTPFIIVVIWLLTGHFIPLGIILAPYVFLIWVLPKQADSPGKCCIELSGTDY